MSRLRVIILDDEPLQRESLAALVDRSGHAEVVASFGRAAEFEQAVRAGDLCDVAFLETHIEHDPTAGLELVRRLASLAAAPQFIFATAQACHAVTAYELGAADYVLKPYSGERVHLGLLRVAAQHSRRGAGSRLIARNKRNLVFLDVEHVIAFEAQSGTTVVHLADATYEVDLALSALADTYGERFTRVHRNWLVPLDRVHELVRSSGEFALHLRSSSLLVPVSRDKAQEVKDKLLVGPGLRRR